MKKFKSIGKNKEDLLRNKIGKHTFYLLPNFITTASLFSGFYSIVQAMNGKYELAAIAIFVAIIMDGLDGRVARLTKTESAFGAEYDSLSDMVSFGVAPALILYVWALKPLGKLGWIAAFVYCCCAAFRLARFNVKLDQDEKKYFFGLPSPAAAALLVSFVWVSNENGFSGSEIFFNMIKMKWVSWSLTMLIALSMVSEIRFYSGKDINLRNSVPFIAILLIILAFVLVSYSPPEAIFIVVGCYFLSGYFNVIRNFKFKKQGAVNARRHSK